MPTITTNLIAVLETIEPLALARQFVALADADDALAREWLVRLVHEGASSRRLLRDLVDAAGPVDLTMFPFLEKDRVRVRYTYRENDEAAVRKLHLSMSGGDKGGAERAVLMPRYAWALIRILDAGVSDRIRRCELDDCRKIFFKEDPRTEFCSKSHGSKSRVRRMREEDRRR
jgi:hypothetical protein